jgi:glycosyltransferase involved in cell wall biosynthesis
LLFHQELPVAICLKSMLLGIDASRALRARRTGTENYARALIEALVALAPHHQFRLYINAATPQAADGWLAGTGNAEFVCLARGRLWTHLALGPELARRPPEVFFEPAHVLPLQHPAASVVTIHDLGYEYFPAAHPLLQRLYLRLTTHWHTRAARTVLADSEATRQDLIRLYGADGGKIQVVYPGVDNNHFQPVRDPARLAAVRGRYGLPEAYLLYVGTLQPRKNLARVIAAFATLASEFPHVGLVLAGQAARQGNELQRQVDWLGLSNRVHFPGYVADQDLPALLTGARVFVFPSLFEGFGLPILEAQACETPVLTSTTSSCPEVAGAGALLVPPTDVRAISMALRRLLSEPSLRAHLVEAGRQNLGRFGWEAAARVTLAVLQEAAR